MQAGRLALMDDWEQGEYIEPTLLNGHISTDDIAGMEQRALNVIESAVEKFDACLFFSGGIDSVVPVHMCHQLGITDIPIMFSYTPNYYDAFIEFTETMAGRMGFDHIDMLCNESMDLDFILENPDKWVFPHLDDLRTMYNRSYYTHADEFIDDTGSQIAITGSRGEDNPTGQRFLYDEVYCGPDQYQLNPLLGWKAEHCLAYLDKYSIPIRYAYKVYIDPPEGFHRRAAVNTQGKRKHSNAELWWIAREIALRHGYNEYWEPIRKTFPEFREMAVEYAKQMNKPFTTFEEGWELGADVRPVVPNWFQPSND